MKGVKFFLKKIKDWIRNNPKLVFILVASFLLRMIFIPIESNDFIVFLDEWTQYLKDNGNLMAIGSIYGNTNCNYYIPYLIIASLVSYLPVSNIFIIKIISIIFDYLLSFAIYKIIFHFTNSKTKSELGLFFTLIFPYFIINSSAWGQCDSIYSFFIVLSIYMMACKKNYSMGVLSWTVAMSFKLQAIFFAPVILVLFLSGRIKIKHLLPSVAYGAGLLLFSFVVYRGNVMYPIQMSFLSQLSNTDGWLSYMAPNIYRVLDLTDITFLNVLPNSYEDIEIIIRASMIAFSVATLVICVYLAYRVDDRYELDSKRIILMSAFFTMFAPFGLPNMHERYYYVTLVVMILAVIIYFDDIRYLLGFSFIQLIAIINVNWASLTIGYQYQYVFGPIGIGIDYVFSLTMIVFFYLYVKKLAYHFSKTLDKPII